VFSEASLHEEGRGTYQCRDRMEGNDRHHAPTALPMGKETPVPIGFKTFPRLRCQRQNRRPLLDNGSLTHGSLGTYPPQRTVVTELTHVYTATDKHGITGTVEGRFLYSVRTEV
jgi:hypothetical protein